jgi:demethylmenaquinone methyltransferase / 2-methoxy-6-polyprenyl-1,4-benzoquinol methylase
MMHDVNQEEKVSEEQIMAMFDSISAYYDRLNRLLSFGIDRQWRNHAIRIIGRNIRPSDILDVATGTGDLAIAALKLEPRKIIGIDISKKMLELGREKIAGLGEQDRIELLEGTSGKILFQDSTFDTVMSAFGVRNFKDTLGGLREMHRVLRPGGMIMVLEFSHPAWFPVKKLYGLYFKKMLPRIGRKVSGNPFAYTYLPDSVNAFPDGEDFLNLLQTTGFTGVRLKKLTGGIASIYYGFKI